MTLFTPALLFFMPFWAAACVLKNSAISRPAQPAVDRDDERSPANWAAMPFTPPPVHVV